MRPIGFSTGALAKGDFESGIDLQSPNPRISAIELSALREGELPALSAIAHNLDLSRFQYVSFHAPSKLAKMDEREAFDLLRSLPDTWPIIVHPELLKSPHIWRTLGSRLCLENMDNRKTTGRTLEEMRELVRLYPQACFCLDLAHARQIDPTMATAIRMLQEFRPKLRQLHVSELGPRSEHRPLSRLAVYAYGLLVDLVPEDCTLIIESVVKPDQMDCEIDTIVNLFALQRPAERRRMAFSRATTA